MSKSSKKSALIGGVYGGIGRALARRLLYQDWRVAGFGRDPDKLEEVKGELDGLAVHQADATDPDEMKSVFKKAAEESGGVDAYIHCVGSVFLKAAHLTSPDEWREVMAKNLDSAFYALRAGIPLMRGEDGGVFLFCSSVAAGTGLANHEAVAAAKGGLEGLVRSAAATYAPRRIRVNAISMGLVETGAAKAILANEQARAVSEQMHPLGRIGKPEEAASLLSWLASDDASWVTGHVYGLDGGMGAVATRPKITRA